MSIRVSRRARIICLAVSAACCLALVLAGGGRAGAAGGGLVDPSFNPGGSGADGALNDLAVQPDGRIIIAGSHTSYDGDAAVPNSIARLKADGTPDATFNPNGAGLDGAATAVALQPDGKILVGGLFNHYNGQATPANLIRLNANGTRDASFNPGGVGATHVVYAIALQPDGKILIGGEFADYNGHEGINHVARLNADGTFDPTFDQGTGANGAVNELAVQPDGKIIIAGQFTTYDGNPAAPDYVARLNTNGSLDATFNAGGAGADGGVLALALQPDGKILVGGQFTGYNSDAAAPDRVARLNKNGTLDATFNGGGAGANNAVYEVALQPDGRVVVAGSLLSYNGDAAVSNYVARLNKNGTPDATFNYGGEGADNAVNSLALQPDGKVVIGGSFVRYNGDDAAGNCVTRLLPAAGDISFSTAAQGVAETAARALIKLTRTGGTDNKVVAKVTLADGTTTPADYLFKPGALDTSFNHGGAGADDTVSDVLVQPDGKVLMGGWFTGYNGDAAAPDHVARLNADGTLDAAFNHGGSGPDGNVYALALQPDGKILIGGDFTTYNGNAAASDRVARLNPDGTLDPTFNPGGAGAEDSVYAIAVQPDGKIIIAGGFMTYNGDPFANNKVLRLNADGTRDPSFNRGGEGADFDAYAAALQPDGKVVIGGSFLSYNGDEAVADHLIRLNADGTRDAAFNAGGAGPDSAVNAVVLQPDGRILISGFFQWYNGNAAAPDRVARVLPNGKLDTTFNYGGAGTNDVVRSMALQPDGKVIIAGLFVSYNDNFACPDYVARLNSNGKLDATFNKGGAGAYVYVFAADVQGDGRIVIGGQFRDYNGYAKTSDGIARLNGDLFATWRAGDASDKTVQLPIVNDTTYEGGETLGLALSIVAGGAGVGASPSSVLTIVDDETAPKVSINNVSVLEDDGDTLLATFNVRLSGASSKPVTVQYQTADGTAKAPADYAARPLTTLTFAPGQTVKAVAVTVKGDLIDESAETFKVVLSSPTGATILYGHGAGVCTIADNDAAFVSVNNVSVTEPDSGTAAMTFTVSLTTANSRTVTVKYQTADGTAAAPADYAARAPSSLSFSPGQTTKTVTVFVRGDLLSEPDETLFVNLSDAANATIGYGQGQGTILNDD